MKKYYPVFIDLTKAKCLVIGGGEVACRKVISLKEVEADITVISPEVLAPLREMEEKGEVKILYRKYRKGDTQGFRLVYVAVPDEKVGRQVDEEVRGTGILLNVADNPVLGNFIVPAKLQRGDLSICISTNGKSPLLAKKIRQDLEKTYGSEYGEWVSLLGEEREKALGGIPDLEKRKAFFARLVDSDLLGLIKEGRKDELCRRMEEIWAEIRGSGKCGPEKTEEKE